MSQDSALDHALERIGKELRAGRHARFPNDSQGDFARRVGVSRYTWQKVENGHGGVAMTTYLQAAELLGILDQVCVGFAPPRRSLFDRDIDR